MVGRFTCDGRAVCGEFQSSESSMCTPNVPLEPIRRLLLEWPGMMEEYLKGEALAGNNIIQSQKVI